MLCGISPGFPGLFPTRRQVIHVLLTRAPLYSPVLLRAFSFDLHVLGTPPALILSQDQTLSLIWLERATLSRRRSKLVRQISLDLTRKNQAFLARPTKLSKNNFLDHPYATPESPSCQGGPTPRQMRVRALSLGPARSVRAAQERQAGCAGIYKRPVLP